MTVDHKSPPKRSEVLPSIRTPGDWSLEYDYSVVIGGQVCIPIQQCGPADSPLAERKANALRLANAAALEDALNELLASSIGLDRATFSPVVSMQRAAHDRWVLARAVASRLLKRVEWGADEQPRETAIFVGNELRNRPVNDAARQLRQGGDA